MQLFDKDNKDIGGNTIIANSFWRIL